MGYIETNSDIVCISWNNDGNRLLVGCSIGTVQIWSYSSSDTNERSTNNVSSEPVKFSICEEPLDWNSSTTTASNDTSSKSSKNENKQKNDETNLKPIFEKIWEKKLANAVKCLKYSPDGSLFATFGEVKTKIKLFLPLRIFI